MAAARQALIIRANPHVGDRTGESKMRLGDIDSVGDQRGVRRRGAQNRQDLGIDPDQVNVNGWSIALGQPIGVTGSMQLQIELDELERRDLSTALVTMCTGGGMGTATIVERV